MSESQLPLLKHLKLLSLKSRQLFKKTITRKTYIKKSRIILSLTKKNKKQKKLSILKGRLQSMKKRPKIQSSLFNICQPSQKRDEILKKPINIKNDGILLKTKVFQSNSIRSCPASSLATQD